MREICDLPELLLQAIGLRRARMCKGFERDCPTRLSVDRFVNHAEAAAAEDTAKFELIVRLKEPAHAFPDLIA